MDYPFNQLVVSDDLSIAPPRSAENRIGSVRSWELIAHERRLYPEGFRAGAAPKFLTITQLRALVPPKRYCS